jgi:hypothetical protein
MEKEKIVILEDDYNDVLKRYSHLNNDKYETFVFLNQDWFPKDDLQENGFNNIYKGLPKKLFSEDFLNNNYDGFVNEGNQIEGDFYCIDGLSGLWSKIAENLPKEKVIITSTNADYVSQATLMGYKTKLDL